MGDATEWKRIEDNDWPMLRPTEWQRIRCQTTPHLSWSVQGQQAVCDNRRLQSPDNWLGHTQGRTRRQRIPGSCPGLLSNTTRTIIDARGQHTRPDPQHRGTHDRRHHDPTTPLKQRPQRHQLQSYTGRKTVRKQYDKDCGLQQSRMGGNTGRVEWDEWITDNATTEENLETFTTILESACRGIPTRKKTRRKRSVWMNRKARKAIRKKTKTWKKYRQAMQKTTNNIGRHSTRPQRQWGRPRVTSR